MIKNLTFRAKNERLVDIKFTDEAITFYTDHHFYTFYSKEDCCSESYIVHVDVPKLGGVILEEALEEMELPSSFKYYAGKWDGTQKEEELYFYKLKTSLGDVVIEMRNYRNSYYGGALDLGKWGKIQPKEIDLQLLDLVKTNSFGAAMALLKEIDKPICQLLLDDALYISVDNNYYKMTKLLLEYFKEGTLILNLTLITALHVGSHEVVKLLLEHGGEDSFSAFTEALGYAASKGYYEIVKLALETGVDVHVNHDLALRYAADNGHYDVVKLIEDWMEKHDDRS